MKKLKNFLISKNFNIIGNKAILTSKNGKQFIKVDLERLEVKYLNRDLEEVGSQAWIMKLAYYSFLWYFESRTEVVEPADESEDEYDFIEKIKLILEITDFLKKTVDK